MKRKTSSDHSATDWQRLEALTDEETDLSDVPELTPEMFARAVVRVGLKPPPPKRQLTLRLDSDVVEWYQAQGRGYQSLMNRLLRAYMEAKNAQAK